jgi:endoglucanase
MSDGTFMADMLRRAVRMIPACLLSCMMLGLSLPAEAAGTGYWHTSGNQILDANNQPVRIAAVNWYGFETTTFVAHGLWASDYKAILNLIKSSGYNTVRIPLSDQLVAQNPVPPSTAINRNGINTDIPANATALQILDLIVTHAGSLGLRVILDNHRSNAGDSAQEEGLWYTGAWPESTWLANWRALTTRYLGNTTVIGMDIRNEPHGPVCWGGDPAGCSSANDWHAAAQRAGNAILAINPNLLIFVEGNDRYNNAFTWWGGMLRGVANRQVVLNVANRVVYSAHDYGPHLAGQPWFNGSTTPASLAAVWDQNFGYIHNQGIAPVWIGEFGTTNVSSDIQNNAAGSQGQWFSSLVSYLAGKPAMSWAYWAMNGNDSYALFNTNFNAIASAQKQNLLATIQFALDSTPGNTPAIASVSPTSGAVGTSVTISGSNFGNSQGTSTVRIGNTNATVTAWNASSISATVPNIAAGAASVVVTVNGVASNAATFTVGTAPQPDYSIARTPASLSVNRGASGTVSITITRVGGFTGSVAFSASGLPAGVTATFSPQSTTGNSTTLTLAASSTATLGAATVTLTASNAAAGNETATVALTVASAPGGGSATITGAVTSNSPWFAEEQVRINHTAAITALTVTITVARNPSGLAVGGQYNTVGGQITQSSSTTSTQLIYTFTLNSGQTLAAANNRTFAAQIRGTGVAHPTSGDSWSVTYTSGGTTTTTSGTF